MKFKSDEIASVIQQEIKDFKGQIQTAEVGRIIEVGDGIARAVGLSSAMSGEMVEFKSGTRGLLGVRAGQGPAQHWRRRMRGVLHRSIPGQHGSD